MWLTDFLGEGEGRRAGIQFVGCFLLNLLNIDIHKQTLLPLLHYLGLPLSDVGCAVILLGGATAMN